MKRYLFSLLGGLALCFSITGSTASAQRLPAAAIQPAPEMYSDVVPSHWAYEVVQQATAQGIFTGYPDGAFRGNAPLNRYEAAVVAARLVDYLDTLVNVLSGDDLFMDSLREAADELGPVSSMGERVARLETALEQAASVAYVEALEARVMGLEQTVNTLLGEERFTAEPVASDVPRSAAEAAGVEAGAGNLFSRDSFGTAPFGSTVPGVVFKTESPHPFYIGIAPGVVSTSGDVYIEAQAGYDAFVGPLGGVVRLAFNSGSEELRLSADATARLRVFNNRFDVYGGIGPGYSFRPGGNAFLLEVPFGAEYRITPRVGGFAQLTTSYTFAPQNSVDATFIAGVNLRF